jgi:hypothetical protein
VQKGIAPMSAAIGAPRLPLNAADQHQDEHNDHDQANAAGRVVAPRRAMPPGGDDADQDQDKDDQQNGSEGHDYLSKVQVNGGVGNCSLRAAR